MTSSAIACTYPTNLSDSLMPSKTLFRISEGRSPKNLVVVDPAVENYKALTNSLTIDAEVVILKAHEDGVNTITRLLSARQNLSSLHIISHGAPGTLYLGNATLSLNTFELYATQLASWGEALAPALNSSGECVQPTISLYGCRVAAGDAGTEFLEKFYRQVQCPVAASMSLTGHASLGGDWDLTRRLGMAAPAAIEPVQVVSELGQAAFVGVLARPTIALGTPLTEYSENAAPVVIDPTITIEDSDSTSFAGGFLSVAFNAGQPTDRLTIAEANGITIDGSLVLYEGDRIGTYAGGYGSPEDAADGLQDLVITFDTPEATLLAVQALARSISYSNASERADTSSTVEFVVDDGTDSSIGMSVSGLRGEYYNDLNFDSFQFVRTDATVNFNFGNGSPDPSIGSNTFSIRWTGQIEPLHSEEYTFYTNSDDGVRLWVNDQLLIDNWTVHPATIDSGTITLAAGQKYNIRMEYFENEQVTVAQLEWESASQVRQIVPQSQLSYSDTSFPLNINSANDAPVLGYVSAAAGIDLYTFDSSQPETPDAYTGNGGTPWLSFVETGIGASQTIETADGATQLNTTAPTVPYAGYSNYTNDGSGLVNANFPTLDAEAGYTLSFTAKLDLENHNDPQAQKNFDGVADRAGFSVLLVSDDPTKAIELGFWEDRIFAQEDGSNQDDPAAEPNNNLLGSETAQLFTQAEAVAFNTVAALTEYDLTVQGNYYTLHANGTEILSGELRDYTAFDGPINPYVVPNGVFLGDDTPSANAQVDIAAVSIVTDLAAATTTALPAPALYTENDPALAFVSSQLRITDVDDGNLRSATVQITDNYQNGEDVLALDDSHSGISDANFNATTGTLNITGTGTLAEFEAALKAVTYENIGGNSGDAERTVTITVSDESDQSNSLTQTIQVTPVNDAPTATDDAGAIAAIPTGSGLLAEVEPNNAIATAQNIDGEWSLDFNSNITDFSGNNTSTTIPHVTISGSGDGTFDYYSFSVAVANSRVILDIDNNFESDGSTFDSDLFLYDIDGTNVLARSDWSTETGHVGGGFPSFIDYTFSTPGTYTIGVRQFDFSSGLGVPSGATYDLHISLEDLVPLLTDEGTSFTTGNVLANDIDPDSSLTIASFNDTSTAGQLTNNNDGTFDYDPNGQFENLAAGESATDTFEYTITDGEFNDTATVTIDIEGVNDAPQIEAQSTPTTIAVTELSEVDGPNDNSATISQSSSITFTDVDLSDTHTASVTADTASATSYGELTATIDPDSTGSGTGQIALSFSVNDADIDFLNEGQQLIQTYTVTINDGLATDAQTVEVTLTGTNDAPVATVDTFVIDEDNTATGNALINDTDQNGDTLTAAIDSQPANGSVDINPDGSFVYTPNLNFSGSDSFTYTASDSDTSSTSTVNLTINATDDEPVLASNNPILVDEGATIIITNALLNVTDADNPPADLTYTVTSVPTYGEILLNGSPIAATDTFTQADIDSGLLTYVHDGSETTADGFSFTATSPTDTVIERVSLSDSGIQSNGLSTNPSISADGRYVTFTSAATNLVDGDTNGLSDVFVYDRQINSIRLVSEGSNGGSEAPTISANGRFVAFTSAASNLVADDTNGTDDVFVYDLEQGSLERVSVDDSGAEGNDFSEAPTISANGRFVTFKSKASGLVADDNNGQDDIFVYDRQENTIERVSVSDLGAESNGSSYDPSISADGRYVTFWSSATNLTDGDNNNTDDIFVYDRENGSIQQVVANSDVPNSESFVYSPSLSADGRYVTFELYAADFTSDGLSDRYDIVVYDRQENSLEPASVNNDGTPANAFSYTPSLSADGRYVSFSSVADNLAGNDSNGHSDIFIYDLQENVLERISLNANGTEGNDASTAPQISGNGRFVTFTSAADNLVNGDSNGVGDVFVYGTPDVDPIVGAATIEITPVNDAPTLETNAGATVAESEQVVLTTDMLNSTDPDDSSAELTYTVTTAPANGRLTLAATPETAITSFTQAEIDAGLVVYIHEGSETTSDSFGFSLADGGEDGAAPVTGDFEIVVTEVNDEPVLMPVDVDGEIVEGSVLSDSGSLSFADPDQGEAVEVAETLTSIIVSNGILSATQRTVLEDGFSAVIASFENGTGTIDWAYSITEPVLDFLSEGETITLNYSITITDSAGSTASQPVTVVITGTNDAPIIESSVASGTVAELADGAAGENASNPSATGSVTFSDVDINNSHTVSVAESVDNATNLGTLTVSPTSINSGAEQSFEWTFSVNDADVDYLAEGESLTQTYTLVVTDSDNATATQEVTITINGTNDGPVIETAVETGAVIEIEDGAAGENVDALTATGNATFSDVDIADSHTVTVTADPDNATSLGGVTVAPASINSGSEKSYEWTFSVQDADIDYLAEGETLTQGYTLTVTDAAGATATQRVDITITGTNDVPVIDTQAAAFDVTGIIVESATADEETDTGAVTFSDVDLSDVHTADHTLKSFESTNDAYTSAIGTFNLSDLLNTATPDGAVPWTFAVDNSALTNLSQTDQLIQVYTVTVDDGQGGTASQDVTITINGANNAPTATDDSVTVDDNFDVVGNVFQDLGGGVDNDADSGSSFSAIALNGSNTLGIATQIASGAWVTLNANGTFRYDPNNMFNLSSGQTATDSFTYTIADEFNATSTATVNVTINGTDSLTRSNGDSDLITGAASDDTITGGRGSDILLGGGGRDVFYYQSYGDRMDQIKDFTIGEDMIDLHEVFDNIPGRYLSATDTNRFNDYVELVQQGAHTEVRLDLAGELGNVFRPLLLIENVTPDQLSASDFVV